MFIICCQNSDVEYVQNSPKRLRTFLRLFRDLLDQVASKRITCFSYCFKVCSTLKVQINDKFEFGCKIWIHIVLKTGQNCPLDISSPPGKITRKSRDLPGTSPSNPQVVLGWPQAGPKRDAFLLLFKIEDWKQPCLHRLISQDRAMDGSKRF